MEKIKSVIADKIIEISSGSADDIKMRLDKVNRFRDFTDACQSLMIKYPAIEEEFIQMVKSNDFDLKVAASRVDTIIRLADRDNTTSYTPPKNESVITESPKTVTAPSVEIEEVKENVKPEEKVVFEIPEDENVINTPPVYKPEDIDYEELEPEVEENKDYAEYEEVSEVLQPEIHTTEADNDATESELKIEIDNDKTARNENIKRGLQVVGVIIAIVLVIFIVVFIKNNWQTILKALAGIAAVALIVWILIKKNKTK